MTSFFGAESSAASDILGEFKGTIVGLVGSTKNLGSRLGDGEAVTDDDEEEGAREAAHEAEAALKLQQLSQLLNRKPSNGKLRRLRREAFLTRVRSKAEAKGMQRRISEETSSRELCQSKSSGEKEAAPSSR